MTKQIILIVGAIVTLAACVVLQPASLSVEREFVPPDTTWPSKYIPDLTAGVVVNGELYMPGK